MRRLLITMACVGLLCGGGISQEATKSTTVTGCLAGPDADNLYTLTSMQHRTGVMVAGGEELKKGAGAKVKLTGRWEALPGADSTKGDAGLRFQAREVSVIEEKCQAPAPVTPVSKKKQQKK